MPLTSDSLSVASVSRRLGPGLATGAADDDPSGISTYARAGTQFGLNMLWSAVLTFPFMVAIKLVSARIGRVSGRGLSANMQLAFPRWLVFIIGPRTQAWVRLAVLFNG